ncbi:hypothetical protein YEEN111655_17945 [Yersinia entomophaga]
MMGSQPQGRETGEFQPRSAGMHTRLTIQYSHSPQIPRGATDKPVLIPTKGTGKIRANAQ